MSISNPFDRAPYEPSWAELANRSRQQAWAALPPQLRELALIADNADDLVFWTERPLARRQPGPRPFQPPINFQEDNWK